MGGMSPEQSIRFWEAVIGVLVTTNTILIAALHYLQTTRWKGLERRQDEMAGHVEQCVQAHQNDKTAV